jgi:cyclophilin family peptidyl-prolyl cis-trans isomerase
MGFSEVFSEVTLSNITQHGDTRMINRFIVIALALAVFASMVAWGQEQLEKEQAKVTKTADQGKSEKATRNDSEHPVVVMKTSMGTITIELFNDKAPVTVKNFLSYVDEHFYDSTVFHRVMSNFMIQGGGFMSTNPIRQKKTKAPIKNESDNGVKNERGTIAMARMPDPNSATSQFFINVVDNHSLDRGVADPNGYAVFGKVISGMDVVDKIRAVKTADAPAVARSADKEISTTFQNVPITRVVIESVRRMKPKK